MNEAGGPESLGRCERQPSLVASPFANSQLVGNRPSCARVWRPEQSLQRGAIGRGHQLGVAP